MLKLLISYYGQLVKDIAQSRYSLHSYMCSIECMKHLIEKSNSKAQKVLWIGSKDTTSAESSEVGCSHIAILLVVLIVVDGICTCIYCIFSQNNKGFQQLILLWSNLRTNIYTVDNNSTEKCSKILCNPVRYYLYEKKMHELKEGGILTETDIKRNNCCVYYLNFLS